MQIIYIGSLIFTRLPSCWKTSFLSMLFPGGPMCSRTAVEGGNWGCWRRWQLSVRVMEILWKYPMQSKPVDKSCVPCPYFLTAVHKGIYFPHHCSIPDLHINISFQRDGDLFHPGAMHNFLAVNKRYFKDVNVLRGISNQQMNKILM